MSTAEPIKVNWWIWPELASNIKSDCSVLPEPTEQSLTAVAAGAGVIG